MRRTLLNNLRIDLPRLRRRIRRRFENIHNPIISSAFFFFFVLLLLRFEYYKLIRNLHILAIRQQQDIKIVESAPVEHEDAISFFPRESPGLVGR